MDENRLEQILQSIKHKPLNEADFSGLSKEEKALAFLAVELKSIPVFTPPIAHTKKKYKAAKELVPFWGNSIFTLRFAVSSAIFVVALIVGGLGFGTANALPGQKLFGLKKSAEQFRVKFATSDMKKAYLQVQIAKKRVAEAQKIIASDSANSNSLSRIIALKELSEATEQAAQGVGTLPPQIITASEPLLASLEDVGSKERDLVSVLETKAVTKDGREDVIALSFKNQIKISEIKQSVEVAAAEEAIASLSESPDAVVISGEITKINATEITVEKTTFIYDEKTVLSGHDSKKLDAAALKPGNKVAVSGKKTGEQLLALKISLLTGALDKPEGEVKGETQSQEIPLNSTTPSSILNNPLTLEKSKIESEAPDPNTAAATFIIEDPSPQFVP